MKVENMTYNAKTAFTERREIIDKLNECINSINTYGPEKIKDLESKNVQQDSDIANLNAKISNIEAKNVNQDDDINNLKNADKNNVKINVLYAEYSGDLPTGKYREFAKIPAENPDSMIVLDVMVSANGANYGFGRLLVGNPTSASWFCKWVYRKSNGWMDATIIQIAKETATGDLMIFAKNPTYTGLSVDLVYCKYNSRIEIAPRVEKVMSTTDYSLDGTDAGIESIVPGSDTW